MFKEHSSKEEDKPTAFATPRPTVATKKTTVLKLKRSSAAKSSEARTETAISELDVDLLLSPLEEKKVVGGVGEGVASSEVGGASVERKLSIAQMKAEM